MFSKVEAIKEKILNEIRIGRFKPGTLIPSRHQLMKKYSCARGSIDAAISDLTRSGILFSHQGKGTFVAAKDAADGLKQVFIVGDYTQTIRDDAWRSTPLAADIQQHLPCMHVHRNDINTNLQKVASPGNAVIWIRPSYSELRVMDYLSAAGIPQLLIGRNFGDYDHVRTDAEAGISTGLEWLVRKAGKEIIYISEVNNPDKPFIAERHLAFYSKAIEMDIPLSQENIFIRDFVNSNMGQTIGQIAEDLLARPKFPKAIFISFIAAVTPFVTFMEARGKFTGKDYHLLFFDQDMWIAQHDGVAMIKQDWRKMDEVAGEWVELQIKGKKEKFQKKIKPEFIIGNEIGHAQEQR